MGKISPPHQGWILAFFFYPFFILGLGSVFDPLSYFTWAGLAFGVVSWVLLVIAKWPQIRKFDLTTFGVEGLPERNQKLYVTAYWVLALGITVMLLPITSTKFDQYISK